MDKVEIVLGKEGNQTCADCSAKSPKWVSLNLNVLICSRCAGVHRSFGTHVSKVRSLALDKISEQEISPFLETDNAIVNQYLEHHVPRDFPKPLENSSDEVRRRFLSAKYVEGLFAHKGGSENRVGQLARLESSAKISVGDEQKGKLASTAFSGVLEVLLEFGRNLKIADTNGKSDPYVEFSTGFQKVKSCIQKKTLDPVWNQKLLLNVQDFATCKLKVDVRDHDRFTSDDDLGYFEVKLCDIERLEQGETVPLVCPLDTQGAISIQLKYMNLC